MPRKKIVTREQIVEAAFSIVRESTPESLSARKIAEMLGCSTQPIYAEFKNMKEIRSEIARKIVGKMLLYKDLFYDKYQNEFLATVLGYVLFSFEQRKYFQFLFSGSVESGIDLEELIEKCDKAQKDLIIYANGIVMMSAFGSFRGTAEEAEEMILSMARRVSVLK